MHINWLELKAVYLTLKHFLPQLKGYTVLIRCHNTTVVQYIAKEAGVGGGGGARSPRLCYITWDIWHLARANNIILKSAHVTEVLNVLADRLSSGRIHVRPLEWSLHSTVVHRLFQIWGTPLTRLGMSVTTQSGSGRQYVGSGLQYVTGS